MESAGTYFLSDLFNNTILLAHNSPGDIDIKIQQFKNVFDSSVERFSYKNFTDKP